MSLKMLNSDNLFDGKLTFSPDDQGKSGRRFGLLSYSTDNLGDDIQSLAALQFLPNIDFFVERDRISSFKNEQKLNLIMNGWFMGRKSWPPSNCINPCFTSFHLSTYAYPEYGQDPSSWLLNDESVEYFRHFQPIGCRDLRTAELLDERGISCYFSGCLTLTFSAQNYSGERREILLVDVNANIASLFNSIPAKLRKNVAAISHDTGVGYVPELRLNLSAQLLGRYSRAHLVVTSRLHCLLPCLALGTPVLFIQPKIDLLRFTGYEGFYHLCEIENGEAKHLIPWEQPEPNPSKHIAAQKILKSEVQRFIGGEVPSNS